MPSLELSMIVKDGARTLARCLSSARGAVDEIIIGDTGSSDATVEIARSFGARIISVPWENDFAKARNAVLREGHCDWVLFLDADEMLDGSAASEIASLLTGTAAGYDVRIWNYVPTLTNRMMNTTAQVNPGRVAAAAAFAGYVEHVNVRLFRRHPAVQFSGQVHEGVADLMKGLGMSIDRAELIVHHLGTAEDSAAEREHKREYYRELGIKKLSENPGDFRALCELGLSELEQFRDPRAAIEYLHRALVVRPRSALIWTYAAICHLRMGQPGTAMMELAKAGEYGARDAVYLEALGDAHYALEQFDAAASCYQAGQQAGSLSSLLACKLGVCEVRLGTAFTGLERILQAVAREPNFCELYDILIAAALFAGDGMLAANAAEHRAALESSTVEQVLLAARLRAQLGDWPHAAESIRRGLQRFPDDARLQAALAESGQKQTA
jgi:tetratricopeptide (TPR) repeat protein